MRKEEKMKALSHRSLILHRFTDCGKKFTLSRKGSDGKVLSLEVTGQDGIGLFWLLCGRAKGK